MINLICLPENKVEDILCRLNSIDKKLKFTLEKSVNNNIQFLDLTIQIINNKIKTLIIQTAYDLPCERTDIL